MSRKIIDVGLKGNDGTGDPIREAFRKINDNFQELYTSLGLVQGFTILSLSDTPNSYLGNSKALLSVNNEGNATVFKQLVSGPGINIDFDTNPNEINLSASFADIVIDQSPQLGGDLSARSGGQQFRIVDLGTDLQPMIPLSKWEAVNKNYADGKVSLAGIDTQEYVGIDQSGMPIIETNTDYGVMTGPLVLSRDPITSDDELWDGKTAATKRYVDGASYFSRINLHVSMNGNDYRQDIAEEKQGRALAYSYRTIEAACKKAQELIDLAPLELGPYGKILTYNNGASFCTLTSITTSVDSGVGCTATPRMSVNGFSIANAGSAYKIGDIVTISGGEGTDPAAFEVTEITEPTGAITKVKLLKSGVYTSIVGVVDNAASTTNSTFGANAQFDLTYRVSSIRIDTPGSNYGLASVRILGGGGSGAFGFVDVVNGQVVSATVTEQGSGFTSSPTVTIELPTFRIFTDSYKTDFTKTQGPSRDIREGLYLRGETSGALANILAHSGVLDVDGNELFDVDIVSGSFINGERISYGDPVKNLHITVMVESGIYEENYPIKLPANVSIKGDEFRRTIIRPRPGMSTSPFAYVKFRRDTVIDGLNVATQPFGYHYLTDSTAPIYPITDNAGGYRSASQILKSNKAFIQSEVIGWINNQILNGNEPFTGTFTYDQTLCKRDVGLIIDAVAYDIRWGGSNRTVSAGLKYYQSASSLIAITTQLAESVAAMERIKVLTGLCLTGLPPGILYGDVDQSIDPAYVAETGTIAIVETLIDSIINIVSNDTSFNTPKENTEMDVFLCNDATILRNVTIQGHGGFAMVLDPEGQILTKSPYAQIGTVFSGSTGRHRFAGGLFIDGFAGNIEFNAVAKDTDYLLDVENLVRRPQTPFSFQVDGVNYRVNYIRNYIFNSAGSTATFVLDEVTPFTPVVDNNLVFEAITAGNRSMLSNDFTQVCDMGYGILATNGGLTEAVGMFTYYCYTAFYALNGAQIRSVGGSCSNGVYALKSEGSDPLEVPITATLYNNVSQGGTVYAPGGTAYENQAGDLAIYVNNLSYVPYNQCQLEIDHSGVVINYIIVNVESGDSLPAGVVKLNLSTAASAGIFSGGLVAAAANGTPVTVRLNNQIRLGDISAVFGTRPSTALIFDETPEFIYRVTTLSTAGLSAGQAQATLREPYQYGDVKVWTNGAQPASHGGVGNTQIAVDAIVSNELIARLPGLQFGWKGTIHTVTGYDSPAVTGQAWGRLKFTTGLAYTVNGFTATPTLRLGSQAGQPGNVTVKISTARFTGHDLLDIGTGSYADTNYPEVIYGDPANAPSQENEVLEIGKGRVFYVTTDQDGNFRVGPFFSIDQGSGTVSFSADLALNNLDGIGFKRGVTIAEFSTDDTMSDNASDTVPTESAVRSYIDRRLGLSHTNGTITAGNLIPFSTGGFLALNGQLPMKGNIDMNVTNRINNLADPSSAQDAVTKAWTKLSNLQDGTLTNVANQDLVMLTGTAGAFVNVANNTSTITNTSTARSGGSDISIARSGNTLTTKLIGGLGSNNPVTDYHINNDAQIQQSKLLMQLAGERVSAPTGTARQKQATAGLASFKDIEFTVTDGFTELQTSTSTTTGVLNNKLQWIAGRTVMGNSSVNTAAVAQITMTDVIDLGGAIKKSLYTTNGYLRRAGVANTNDTDYIVVEESVASVGGTLVKRDTNGDFQSRTITVANLRVDDKLVLDTEALAGTDTGVVKMYAYRGAGGILLGDGAAGTDKVNFYDNDLHEFRTLTGFKGTVKLGTLTTGGVGTAGTLTGAWSLSTTSNLTLGTGTIDASTGTLKSLSLTTGSAGTAGTITGTWSLAGASSLTLQSGGKFDASSGTLQSTTLSAGAAGTAATITGTWSLNTGSTISPGNGTINASYANEAKNNYFYVRGTSPSIQFVDTDQNESRYVHHNGGSIGFLNSSGNWVLRCDNTTTYGTFSGSLTGVASSVVNQANSATITSATGATANTIVLRDGNGDTTSRYNFSTYNNTTDDVNTGSITYIMAKFGDNYHRSASAAKVAAFISGQTFNTLGQAGTIASQANSATITAATANTANTIVLRDVNGDFSARIMSGTATTARYADLAERYAADKEYAPGTVVVFGGNFEITQSTKLLDTRVAGVISTNPAHLMNSEAGNDKTHPPVALQGRVPCRVVGKIQKGDMLVTSSIPGVAIATSEPKIGTVIGKALENYDNDHIGVIEVVVGRA